MKKTISTILIVLQLFVIVCSVNAESTQLSNYELYYPKLVDSKEPLSVLRQKDLEAREVAYKTHPILSETPDKNRVDYFNISYGSDPMQKLDIHHDNTKVDKKRPVIFFIHGGGWIGGDKNYSRYAGPTWVALGYTVVSINYRLAPTNTHPTQIEDCAMALKWVIDNIKDYGGDANRIAISGNSSGAHLAALLVTNEELHKKFDINKNKIKCWFPMCGIYDFNLEENYYQPDMASYNNAYLGNIGDIQSRKNESSPKNHVTKNVPPSLILHGGDDWLVPKTNSITMYNKLKEVGANTELEILKGYYHINLLYNYAQPGDVTTQIVNKFLAKHLPTPENNLLKYYIDYLIKKFKN